MTLLKLGQKVNTDVHNVVPDRHNDRLTSKGIEEKSRKLIFSLIYNGSSNCCDLSDAILGFIPHCFPFYG